MTDFKVVILLISMVVLQASSQQADNSSIPSPLQQDSGNSTFSPALEVFAKLHANQYMGVARCKTIKDCGLGLKCDSLLGLCLPIDVPSIPMFERLCQNDMECSALYSCIAGACTFCGPKRCSKTTECCSGVPGRMFKCTSLESNNKQLLSAQLSKPVAAGKVKKGSKENKPAKDDSNSVESDEVQALGLQTALFQQGKRCWAQCISDADCQGPKLPAQMNAGLACCRGYCLAKDACFGTVPLFPFQAPPLQQFALQPQSSAAQNASQPSESANTTTSQQESSTTLTSAVSSTSEATTAAIAETDVTTAVSSTSEAITAAIAETDVTTAVSSTSEATTAAIAETGVTTAATTSADLLTESGLDFNAAPFSTESIPPETTSSSPDVLAVTASDDTETSPDLFRNSTGSTKLFPSRLF